MKITVAGLSTTGQTLVKVLKEDGHSVTVIDIDRAAVEAAEKAYGVRGLIGNSALSATLLDAGVAGAELFIGAAGSAELNMLSCLSAKSVGCPRTVAVSRSPDFLKELPYFGTVCGIDMMFDPDYEVAGEIFRIISIPAAIHVLSFAGGRAEMAHIEVRDGSGIAGKTLAALRLSSKLAVLVCAVKRNGKVIIPDGRFVLEQGDDIYITGPHNDLYSFLKLMGMPAAKVKNAIIIGGGNISLFLAQRLERSGVAVKMIEKNAARCAYLEEVLDKTRVICGDPFDLLSDAGLDTADAVIALSGREEDNAILSMYAKKRGAKKLITRLSKDTLEELLPDLGYNSAVVSTDKTVSRIALTYVRALKETAGSSVSTVCKIADGGAEIVEFIAKPGFAKAGVPLMKLDLRPGLLLAGIVRGREVLYPNGMTSICEGDRVIIVASGVTLRGLEDILE